MADPKTTNRFVSTDSKFDFYANVISHAELYANNISANSFNVGSQTLEEYIQSVGGGSGDVTNNYVTATFVSNNYLEDIKSTFGTGDVTNNYLTAIFSSNNYIQDILDTKATNTYVNSTFSSNNYIQDQLDLKATNTYVNSTFTSNNYVEGRFTSNNYVESQLSNKVSTTHSGDVSITGNVTITSTEDGSSAGPDLILYRNSASPNDGDYIGQIQFKGRQDGPGDEIYAKVTGKISDSTNSTEDGLIETAIKGNGTFTIVSRQKSNELQLLNGVGLSVDGSITVGGTVDGRDIASDGSTLDSISSTYASNNYLVTTFASNNYLQDRLTAFGNGDVTNNYLVATFTSNNYVQTQLGLKLNSSSYTAADVLTKIKTVDGAGSGLDADTLDGLQGSSYSSNNYITNHYTTNNYIQTFVAAEVAGIVDSAPAALDTLNELAAALGDDANFSTTVSNQIGLRATNTYVNSTFSSNNYIIGNFASNNYVTGNFVSNNYLTAGQISNINVSQLQVGEEDSAAGGVLTVYGRQTGETVGGEIRLHTAADHDTNIPYYAIKTSGEDFVIELNGGTDVITIDYSTGSVDVPTGRVDLGVSDNTYGELRLYGNGTGSSQGGLIRMYTAADYDSSIDFFNMKATSDDWHLEKGNGDDILSYYGGSNELRFGATLAYVSVGASDSSKGSLYLWSDGTGSVNGGELRIYNAPDHDTNVNYYSIYAESGDLLISYGSTDFLQYDETASQWLMPRSGGLDVTGNITTSGTVDGRDVAADGTKLDGIEAGATADQTASEILTAIKTVDGSGSGLDADTLDGQQGSYYLDWTNTTNKPDPVITLGGDLSGSVTLTDLASGTLTATIQPNSVALGTDTTGNYVATISGTTNEIEVSGSGSEGAGVTVGLPNDVTIGNDLTVTNDIIQTNHTFVSSTITTTSTTQTNLDTFSTSTYSGAEVNVTAISNGERHMTKILVVHDGTTAYATEYGSIFTNTSLATYDVDISSGSVRLRVTPASATSTVFNTSMMLIEN